MTVIMGFFAMAYLSWNVTTLHAEQVYNFMAKYGKTKYISTFLLPFAVLTGKQ